jgi:hypothetical protein
MTKEAAVQLQLRRDKRTLTAKSRVVLIADFWRVCQVQILILVLHFS